MPDQFLLAKAADNRLAPAVDAQWLEEYAKRDFLRNLIGAMGDAWMWDISRQLCSMIIKKASGDTESLLYHRKKTPLVMAGMLVVGQLVDFIYYDQQAELARLRAQRLARRIVPDTEPMHTHQSFGAESKVSWWDVLIRGRMRARSLSPDSAYEAEWCRQYRKAEMQISWFGAVQCGAFWSTFLSLSSMALDKAGGKKVPFDPRKTPKAIASILGVGTVFHYLSQCHRIKAQLLEDNYVARLITLRRQQAASAKTFLILPGENMSQHPASSQEKTTMQNELSPPKDFKAYDNKWLQDYRNFAFQKGLCDAIALASFLGMFAKMSGMLLDYVGGGKNISFHKIKTPATMAGLMSFGVGFAYMGNTREAMLQKMQDDRLAHRIVGGQVNDPLVEETTMTEAEMISPAASSQWQNLVLTQKRNQPAFALSA